MSEEILINVTPQETRVAVLYLGVVQELHIERAGSRGLVGNVYLGKVCRVLPGMQSAFIDIGLDRAAFLHVGDIVEARGENSARPIEKVLHEGRAVTRATALGQEERELELARMLAGGKVTASARAHARALLDDR